MAAGDLYSAGQIVGKDLFAKTEVPLKRLPFDSAPVVFKVSPGKTVGNVFSWLNVKPGERANLYWMFYDSAGKPYYGEHVEGRFSTSELDEQGALTVKEQVAADKAKDETTTGFIERLVKYSVLSLGGFMLVRSFIPHLFGNKKK